MSVDDYEGSLRFLVNHPQAQHHWHEVLGDLFVYLCMCSTGSRVLAASKVYIRERLSFCCMQSWKDKLSNHLYCGD